MTSTHLRTLIADTQRVRAVCSIVSGARLKSLLDALENCACWLDQQRARRSRQRRAANLALSYLLALTAGVALCAWAIV